MPPVDLDHLRALHTQAIKAPHTAGSYDHAYRWGRTIDAAAPAFFDELEALRRDVADLHLVIACVAPAGEPNDSHKCGTCRNCVVEERNALRAEVERLRSTPTTIPKCHRCAEREPK